MPSLIAIVASIIIIVVLIVLSLAYWRNGHFKRRGVSVYHKSLPILGHMKEIFLNKEHFVETLLRVYQANAGQRYTGFFAFTKPIILVRDLDLIKKVGVKDFDHFIDHKVFMDEEAEPLLGCNLFFLRGQKWRDMRMALSPAYTGSKMKAMYPLITECAEQMRDYLIREYTQYNDKLVMEMEMKEVLTRYTNDVIASTAFGFRINSYTNGSNEFYMMGKKATNFSGWQFLKFQAYATFPRFMKFLKLGLFPYDVAKYFRELVHKTIDARESQGISRPDMIQLLMQAKKGSLQYDTDFTHSDDARFSSIQDIKTNLKAENIKREWTNDELTAQAIAFIIAGFGTPSSLLTFTAFELARHMEVQKKLQQEIDNVYEETKGKPSYTDLLNMKYMDMVVSETLRLWPPDGMLERICVKPYTFPPQNSYSSKQLQINVGDDLLIPIFSIQRDPEYFDDPEKFDPERFSDENKPLIKPFTYIPFGVGPRLCIGARFALMETKALLFHFLAHFEISVSKKTVIPFELAKDTFNMHPESGLWLGLRRRRIE